MPHIRQEENKQDSKDEAIVIVDDKEENNKSKEETPLIDEGIKDELRKKPVLFKIQNKGMKTLKKKMILEIKVMQLGKRVITHQKKKVDLSCT
jgi:hypothetical protein